MKVGLIDIDSKIPNLALMKISAHHKQKGHTCHLTGPLYADQYDKVFASKVFDFSPMPILPDGTQVGGSGHSLEIRLDEQIEHIMPDYLLYPKMAYSLGFTTRGCFRKCPFCIVPQKEGKPSVNADIYEFWHPDHREIVLLDNNIFAFEEHFEKVCEQILTEGLKVDFNQGLDIRLLDDTKTKILKGLHPRKQWRFAFDGLAYEKAFRRGAELLLKHKVSRSQICVYVLAGYDESIEDTIKRIDIVYNEYGFDPFVMLYQDNPDYKFLKKWGRNFKEYKNLARWVNHKAIFKSVKWEEYRA